MNEMKPVLAYDLIMSQPPQVTEAAWTERDTVIYNLGVGFGAAAIADPRQLSYVLEERPTAFPTMVSVLGMLRGSTLNPAFNIDYAGMLHGEEEIEIFKPLPPSGVARAISRTEDIWDKGPGRGAVMRSIRELSDAATGERIATVRSTIILRNNGGFGGSNEGAPSPRPAPERSPDGHIDMQTQPEQALLYRLSGDLNPLHSDPETARRVGFPRPILMGLCSFAIAGRALVLALADGDESRLRTLGVRFTGVVYPGETIRIQYWHQVDGDVAFQARVIERDTIVLNGGRARLI